MLLSIQPSSSMSFQCFLLWGCHSHFFVQVLPCSSVHLICFFCSALLSNCSLYLSNLLPQPFFFWAISWFSVSVGLLTTLCMLTSRVYSYTYDWSCTLRVAHLLIIFSTKHVLFNLFCMFLARLFMNNAIHTLYTLDIVSSKQTF